MSAAIGREKILNKPSKCLLKDNLTYLDTQDIESNIQKANGRKRERLELTINM